MKFAGGLCAGASCFFLFAVWPLACSSTPSSEAATTPTVDGSDAERDEVDAANDSAVTLDADAAIATDAADAAPIDLREVRGHVEAGGALVGATVSVLSPPMVTTTDGSGNFTFYLPLGAAVVIKVEPPGVAYLPMIRGLVVGSSLNRTRNFYLVGPQEHAALDSLGLTRDPAKALVAVDFRNATQGGYSATLKSGDATLEPAFGVAIDGTGNPRSTTVTLAGGIGSTLYLGNVVPSEVSFTPHIGDAGLQCQPCDGPVLPTQAGVVTWYDFECGSATDCL